MEEDGISQLPDPILQQILSLMDTNEAVQTTILSTRWKNLCFSLSDLHFDITRFAAHSRFSQFVSNFLSHRDDATAVRNFHLSFDTRANADAPLVEECVLYAINHGVQSLHLHGPCSLPLTLPASFLASETLRELELRQFQWGIYVPGGFSLPHLKTLYLDSVVFLDDPHSQSLAYSKEPFSGFPELEKLCLRGFPVSWLALKAPKLRFLEIIEENKRNYVMEEISAPLLTSFRYDGYFPFECSKVNLPMLEEVYFDIHKRWNERGMHLRCVRMLQLFGNAKIVALTLDTLKVLAMDGGQLIEQSPPPFPYMKCLKLVKGRCQIPTVLQTVINYLTVGTLNNESLMVEFPHGVTLVEHNSEDLFDDEDGDAAELMEFLFE